MGLATGNNGQMNCEVKVVEEWVMALPRSDALAKKIHQIEDNVKKMRQEKKACTNSMGPWRSWTHTRQHTMRPCGSWPVLRSTGARYILIYLLIYGNTNFIRGWKMVAPTVRSYNTQWRHHK
jgi:hypothetical protein